jgi:hypothetical protein
LYGATCEFAVLDCPSCISSYRGGGSISIYGVGLDSVFRLRVAGRSTEFNRAQWVNASNSVEEQSIWQRWGAAYPQLQSLTLITPALVNITNSSSSSSLQSHLMRSLLEDTAADPDVLVNPPSAYKQLTLDSVLLTGGAGTSTSSSFLQVNYSSLLFYSSSSCGAGVWKEDGAGDCLPCPLGGICPGGGRVWPLPGYWSWNEWQAPVACARVEACPGYSAESALSSGGTDSAYTDTQQCTEAYTGARCADCSPGYYQLNGQCFFCGSDVDQSATIALTVIVGLSAMAALAVAAASLSALQLADVINVFVLLQGVAMVGVKGAASSPFFGQELSALFTYLNFSPSHTHTGDACTRSRHYRQRIAQ